MNRRKTIKLSLKKVNRMINDLSLAVVSLDRLGSTYHNKPGKLRIELERYFKKAKLFNLLARTRGELSDAVNAQCSKVEVLRMEERAEKLPYWTAPPRPKHTRSKK